jgi:hypothetical protein
MILKEFIIETPDLLIEQMGMTKIEFINQIIKEMAKKINGSWSYYEIKSTLPDTTKYCIHCLGSL